MTDTFLAPTRQQLAKMANNDPQLIRSLELVFDVAGSDVFSIQTEVDALAVTVTANSGDILTNAAAILVNTAGISANAAAILANEPRLGDSQTWQDVSGSRAHSTSYQNTTGKPIQVSVWGSTTAVDFQVSTDNSSWISVGVVGGTALGAVGVIIPDNHYYRVNGATTIVGWAELRA